MKVQSFQAPQIRTLKGPEAPKNESPAPAPQNDGFKPSEKSSTVAQWTLGAVAAVGVGALGYFAGSTASSAAAVAGAVSGAIAGGVAVGTVGLFSDVMGGIMSNSNNTKPAALIGAALGGVGGGLIGAYASNPYAGVALGLASALTAGIATAAVANDKLG